MFQTRITELLGIQYSIQARLMAYLLRSKLVSAVSNVGNTGILVSVTIHRKRA